MLATMEVLVVIQTLLIIPWKPLMTAELRAGLPPNAIGVTVSNVKLLMVWLLAVPITDFALTTKLPLCRYTLTEFHPSTNEAQNTCDCAC